MMRNETSEEAEEADQARLDQTRPAALRIA